MVSWVVVKGRPRWEMRDGQRQNKIPRGTSPAESDGMERDGAGRIRNRVVHCHSERFSEESRVYINSPCLKKPGSFDSASLPR